MVDRRCGRGVAALYHSSAILLPDGSVLVGGGGAPGPMINVNAEIYFPPYLFTANGALAPRPRIVSAPDLLGIGQTFTVEFANASSITRVACSRLARSPTVSTWTSATCR